MFRELDMPISYMTIARPYAKAIFAWAQAEGKLTEWKSLLHLFARIARYCKDCTVMLQIDQREAQLLNVFGLDQKEISAILPDAARNLLRLLIKKQQLQVLPEIYYQYSQAYYAEKKILRIDVTTPFVLSPHQKSRLRHFFANKYGKRIILCCYINADLIGGVYVKIGDNVIDGSVRNKLRKLNRFLLAK